MAVKEALEKAQDDAFPVEEKSPLEVIADLQGDLMLARRALRRITKINPAALPGGSSNRYFGKRYIQALELAQNEALSAYLAMDNQIDPDPKE